MGRKAERIVVKVGTSTLTDAQGRLDRPFVADLTTQLAALHQEGREVVLVSSGAIRAGREALQTRCLETEEERASRPLRPAPHTLPYKQAAAAIGQGLLMHTYTEAFGWRNTACAQVLLTREDLSDRRRFLNARNTLLALLALRVIPVINENDTVAVDEIKFGDNDTLAALVATLVEADQLLILSDVEGLYDRPPNPEGGEDSAAVLISEVHQVDAAIQALGGDSVSGVGSGGMRTKLEAARIATAAGIRTTIARGRRERVILEVAAGEACGTTFFPQPDSDRLSARKRWIAHGARVRGSVRVNPPAQDRLLHHGVSLLAVGIVEVAGEFTNGDLIAVCDTEGNAFARGLTNYAASELRRIQGLRSDQFEEALGYRSFDEVVHRDNLVIEGGGKIRQN